MPNTILPINGASDARAQLAQHNANFAKLDNDTITKAYKGPNGKDAVIEGQLPDNLGSGILMNDLTGNPVIYMATDPNGNPILKVAKAGQNATTATDANLIFSSSNNILRVAKTGSATLTRTGTGGRQWIDVTHGLGVIPAIIAYVKNPLYSTYSHVPFTLDVISGTAVTYGGSVNVTLDSSIVEFSVTLDASISALMAGDWLFTYYLLVQTAA